MDVSRNVERKLLEIQFGTIGADLLLYKAADMFQSLDALDQMGEHPEDLRRDCREFQKNCLNLREQFCNIAELIKRIDGNEEASSMLDDVEIAGAAGAYGSTIASSFITLGQCSEVSSILQRQIEEFEQVTAIFHK